MISVLVNSDDWQSIYTLSGLTIGTGMLVTNQYNSDIYFYESSVKPAQASDVGFPMGNNIDGINTIHIHTGSLNVWIKSTSPNNKSLLLIQPLG